MAKENMKAKDGDTTASQPGSAPPPQPSNAADRGEARQLLARFPVMEGPYLRDLLEQPLALAHTLDGLRENDAAARTSRELAAGRFRRVVLTGMGSSLYALYPLHLALGRRGVMSCWIETAELLLGCEALRQPDTLLVAVSQSGESGEIVQLLEQAGQFGRVLGVTNHAESRLGRQSDPLILMRAGSETTVSCKSYLATLAVLHWLGAVLLQQDPALALAELEAAAHGVRDYLERWRQHVAELLLLTEGVQSLFLTGRGESLATTATGGLILKEATRHPAEGMSSPAFRHGPLELIGPTVFVLVFAGDAPVASFNRRLVDDIRRGGGRAALAAAEGASASVFKLPSTCPALRPLVEILPVQMLSLALAARDGREAGRFEHARKITTLVDI